MYRPSLLPEHQDVRYRRAAGLKLHSSKNESKRNSYVEYLAGEGDPRSGPGSLRFSEGAG